MSPEPVDEFLSKVASVEDDLRSLQDGVSLSSINGDVGRLDTQLRDLPASIQQARSRGYVFKSYLEKKAEVLNQQWGELRYRVLGAVDEQSRTLRVQADAVQQRAVPLRASRDEGEVAAVAAAVSDLESRVSAARDSIQGLYGPLKDNVNQTVQQVKDIGWVLDQVDAACFKLYPGEGVVSAVKAQWMTSEKEGPKGFLYLTEDRLLFEQKEEVATKKILFVATEKQKVQKLQWEAAAGQIEAVVASEKGGTFLGIGKQDMLELQFDSRSKVRTALLHLEADSDAWQALVGRVKAGEIASERTAPRDQAATQAVRAAPTKCPTCGATIDQPIVRGMNQIKCEYCGCVIRL
jgi:hypothetical protein